MEEESDPDVGSEVPEHGRNQLELVVVHPDDVTGLGHGSGLLGESTVHGDVGSPPGPMKLGRAHPVVIEGPEGAVAEAVIEVVFLSDAEGHGHLIDAVDLELTVVDIGHTGPSHPGPAPTREKRRERADEPARAGLPLPLLIELDGQPVGDDDQSSI